MVGGRIISNEDHSAYQQDQSVGDRAGGREVSHTHSLCMHDALLHRDFGYVSRDPITRKHRCHVFRCSMAARQVAHELLEAHQQQRNARSVSYTSKKAPEGTTPTSTGASGTTPTSGSAMRHGGHEHYERFSCMYIGACTVSKREGMEVLNEAVQRLTLSKNLWQDACVDVATSNIVIIEEKVADMLHACHMCIMYVLADWGCVERPSCQISQFSWHW